MLAHQGGYASYHNISKGDFSFINHQLTHQFGQQLNTIENNFVLVSSDISMDSPRTSKMSPLEEIINVSLRHRPASDRLTTSFSMAEPVSEDELLSRINETRRSSEKENVLTGIYAMMTGQKRQVSSEKEFQDLCDSKAATILASISEKEPSSFVEPEDISRAMAIALYKDGIGFAGPITPKMMQNQIWDSAHIATEQYNTLVEIKCLPDYFTSNLTRIHHSNFLNGIPWHENARIKAFEALYSDMSNKPALDEIPSNQLETTLNTWVQNTPSTYFVSPEGGRFKAKNIMNESEVPRLHSTQIRTAKGDIYELLNTLDQDEFDLLCQKEKINLQSLKVVLGKGGFGKVRLARNVLTEEIVAVKKMNNKKAAETEIQQHQKLGQNNGLVVAIDYAHVKVPDEHGDLVDKSYLFMPLFNKGDGFDALSDKIDDKALKYITYSYINRVATLHEKNIAHRDIKPDNFVFSDQIGIWLTDFGLAQDMKNAKDWQLDFAGTHGFLPPEMGTHQYNGIKHDSFSLALTLLTTKFEKDLQRVKGPHLEVAGQKISLKVRDIHGNFSGINRQAPHLRKLAYTTFDEVILGLLDKNVETRLTPLEALNTPFLKTCALAARAENQQNQSDF